MQSFTILVIFPCFILSLHLRPRLSSPPVLFPLLQPPTPRREDWLQPQESPLPQGCSGSQLFKFIVSSEGGGEWAGTLDFSCRIPCLCRQDGICKRVRDYPRCQFQQRASKFANRGMACSKSHRMLEAASPGKPQGDKPEVTLLWASVPF